MSHSQTGERTWIDEPADRFESDSKQGGDDALASATMDDRSLVPQSGSDLRGTELGARMPFFYWGFRYPSRMAMICGTLRIEPVSYDS